MNNKKPTIGVFGLGHIGLPTAVIFAKNGFNVIGIDLNPKIVDMINKGKSPIEECGLGELIHDSIKSKKLSATNDGKTAAKLSDVMIIVVPTPKNNKNESELSAVQSVCHTISNGLNKGDLVIVESTVPPGACDEIIIPILENSGLSAGEDFGVAYTPERALPTNTIHEMTHNARVIGGINDLSAKKAFELYKNITKGEIVILDNLISAEMVKLMENTYRDVNIALANEFAILCENLGVNAIKAIEAANHHPRVNIHSPGPGVGGHCLSIDPYFIIEKSAKMGIECPVISTSRQVNEKMPIHVANLIIKSLLNKGKKIENSKIGILGIAYKGNVADARETPAITLIKYLKNRGAQIYAQDPFVDKNSIENLGAIPSPIEDVLYCDCVVLLTDHDIYKKIKPSMIKNNLFICTRPVLNPEEFLKDGVDFKGVGIP
ncbi:nucleotide sugar dehydrogenase [Methanobacterium formicicum]|uniref:nucleotide sugar dehydrogenase n=1 Tax=Methanobacterium formicicum TaxID=2162 RepID=UPI00241275D6|nr:nucleotide sugar dehydrogenase [Methanobacterium formicicum]MDG3547073.1 nucleotide sugar dehydrogenase [Methanobacterium formicicum]